MASTDTTSDTSSVKLTFLTMTGMVVGSMVGAGVFSLPRRFGQETGVYGALVAWVIAGTGMLMLAFVFQTLAVRKPDLDAGGGLRLRQGRVRGVHRLLLRLRLLGQRLCRQRDLLGADHVHGRGHRSRARPRRHAAGDRALHRRRVGVLLLHSTRRKGCGGHQPHRHRRQGHPHPGLRLARAVRPRPGGVRRQPPRRRRLRVVVRPGQGHDAGHRLRVPGRGGGQRLLPARQAARGCRPGHGARVPERVRRLRLGHDRLLRHPALRPARRAAPALDGQRAGSRGRDLGQGVRQHRPDRVRPRRLPGLDPDAAEVLFVAAKDDDMPRFLRRTKADDVPIAALVLSTILVQLVLVVTLFSEDAFNFALDLTSALTLIPFLLAAAYALKLALIRETYTEQPQGWGRELVVGALATIYTGFLLFAAGPRFILVSFIIYAPATILFVMARREQGRQLFSSPELVILAVSVIGAVLGVVALAAGWISI